MSGTHGQASVEWAGLLALAALVGAGSRSIAGAAARRTRFAGRSSRRSPAALHSSTGHRRRPPTSPTCRRRSRPRPRRSRPMPHCSRLSRRHGIARAPRDRRRDPPRPRAQRPGARARTHRRVPASRRRTTADSHERPTGTASARTGRRSSLGHRSRERVAHSHRPFQTDLDVASIVPAARLIGRVRRTIGAPDVRERCSAQRRAGSRRSTAPRARRDRIARGRRRRPGRHARRRRRRLVARASHVWRDGRRAPRRSSTSHLARPSDYRHLVYLRPGAGSRPSAAGIARCARPAPAQIDARSTPRRAHTNARAHPSRATERTPKCPYP